VNLTSGKTWLHPTPTDNSDCEEQRVNICEVCVRLSPSCTCQSLEVDLDTERLALLRERRARLASRNPFDLSKRAAKH
jgi:hypothetical protein